MNAPTWSTDGHHLTDHDPRWLANAARRRGIGGLLMHPTSDVYGPPNGEHVHLARHGVLLALVAHRHGVNGDVGMVVRLTATPGSPITSEHIDAAAAKALQAYAAWGFGRG